MSQGSQHKVGRGSYISLARFSELYERFRKLSELLLEQLTMCRIPYEVYCVLLIHRLQFIHFS